MELATTGSSGADLHASMGAPKSLALTVEVRDCFECECSPRLSRRVTMPKEKPDLIYGTLDMLILRSLQSEPRHSLAIADRIQQISAEVLRVGQGSLYPALYRLEAERLIRAEWGISDNNRKARYYELTSAGRKQLTAEMDHWARITEAVNAILAEA
jgi:PadR family transcriptional regulator PadR